MLYALAGLALGFAPSPALQIGEVSKTEFLNLLSRIGYETEDLGQYYAKVRDGSTSFHIVVAFHANRSGGPSFVGSATARAEFGLPSFLGKKQLAEWQAQSQLESVSIHSFLDGRVVIVGHLSGKETTIEELQNNVGRMLNATRNLEQFLAPLGGKPTGTIHEVGKAKLDLNAKLEFADEEDFVYLRQQFGWLEPETGSPYGVIRGWLVVASVSDIPVLFSGFGASAPRFTLTCMTNVDPPREERLRKTFEAVTWADASVQEGRIYIQKWVDTGDGITVREVRDLTIDFATRVKGLRLFGQ